MLDEFVKAQRDLQDASRPRPQHPKGWEPGIDTAKRTLTVQAGDAAPTDWARIIAELGLDPAQWTVDESQPVQVRSWDAAGGQRLFYYRATVVPNTPDLAPDIDALVALIKRSRKSPQNGSQRVSGVSTESPQRALVVCLADWQAGKDLGDGKGVEHLVGRLLSLRDAVPARLKALRKAGVAIDSLAVFGLGDLSESCDNHYSMQQWQTTLDYREQARLTRRMIVELLTAWVPHVEQMQVGCVPGNHGQRRKDGKVFTNWGDNTDVEVFEIVREALLMDADRFGHIRWAIPDQEQTVALDVCGTIIGLAHGHQFRAGAGPQGKALSWWKNMAMNRQPIGDADILLSGHYHHLQVHTEGVADSAKGRTWMQAPALDPGSPWWEHTGGAPTRQGTLTFTVDSDGWDNLKVLR
jgi:hypothetical protein